MWITAGIWCGENYISLRPDIGHRNGMKFAPNLPIFHLIILLVFYSMWKSDWASWLVFISHPMSDYFSQMYSAVSMTTYICKTPPKHISVTNIIEDSEQNETGRTWTLDSSETAISQRFIVEKKRRETQKWAGTKKLTVWKRWIATVSQSQQKHS